MADGDDMTDWGPGQPPPWLAAYGPVPPPLDASLAGAPGAPMPAPAPPAMPEMQPGLGLPAAAVDAAAANAQPAPPFDLPQPQPGMGIPASAVDNAAANARPAFLKGLSQGVAGVANDASGSIGSAVGEAPGAISGAANYATAGLARKADEQAQADAKTATDPNALGTDRVKAWQALPADMRSNIIASGDPNALAALADSGQYNPEELAKVTNKHEMARLHEESTQRLELARKTNEEAQQNLYAQQVAFTKAQSDTAGVAAEAQKLSQQKIDPNEHGVGNFVASVLAGFIGGAESQYTGGRNMALEELDKRTQTRIDAQKANLANAWQGVNFKRNVIAEQYQRSGDMYRAQETYRISTYDRAIAELQTKMQDYDPQGTTALRGATWVQQIQAARGQALQAFAQKTFDNQIAAAKVDFEAKKAAQEAQQKQAQLELENTKSLRETGLGYSRIASEDKRAANELDEKRADRTDKKDQAAQKDYEERGLGDPATGEPLVTAQGQPLIAQARELAAKGDLDGATKLRAQAAQKYGIKIGDKTEAPKVQQTMAFAQSMSDKLAMLKAQLDADPDFTNRSAWGAMGTMFEGMKVDEIKALGMNASSREMAAFHDVFGDSPEEFESRLRVTGGQQKLRAKIQAAEQGLEQDVDALLKANRVQGGWKPTPLTTYKPEPTSVDLLQANAMAEHPNPTPTESGYGTAKKVLGYAYPGLDKALGVTETALGIVDSDLSAPKQIEARSEASRQAAISQIGRQAEVAQSAPEFAAHLAALDKVAKDGVSKSDRELAAGLAEKLRASRTTAQKADVVESGTSRLDGDTQSSAAPEPETNSTEAP